MSFVVFLLCVAVLFLFVRRQAIVDEVQELRARIERLESTAVATASPASPLAPMAPAAPIAMEPVDTPDWYEEAERPTPPAYVAPPVRPHEPRVRSTLERVIAEHALALVGGLFVLVAAISFVTYAIDQGWISPALRIALAIGAGIALVAAGIKVASGLPEQERQGRAIGSLHGVLAGTGAAVVFLAIIAGVRLEELFSPTVGVLLQVVTATGVVALARQWRSQDLGAFGMGVALAGPLLVGASATPGTLALLGVALAGSVVLAVIEQWPRLLLAATLITAPQLTSLADGIDPDIGFAAAVLVGWWALLAAGCLACAARTTTGAARSVVGTILAVPVAAAGVFALVVDQSVQPPEHATAWFLGGLAALHVLLAAGAARALRGRADVLVVALLGAGAALLATAVGDAADGAAVVVAWSAEAVALAALYWRTRGLLSAAFALAMATAALVHAFALDAPVELWLHSEQSLLRPLVAMAAITASALSARWLQSRIADADPNSRSLDVTGRALELLAALAAWHAVAITIVFAAAADVELLLLGAWFAVGMLAATVAATLRPRVELQVGAGLFLLGEVTALVVGEHHGDSSALAVYLPAAVLAFAWGLRVRDRQAAALPLLVLASQVLFATFVVLERVPVTSLRTYDAGNLLTVAAFLLLQLGGVALLVAAVDRWKHETPQLRRVVHVVGALSALYAISVFVVGAFTPTPGRFEQAAQVALTLTWVALGVVALLAGTSQRLRRHTELRIGAYALLALGAAKLVLVDTADLGTPMRMLAFLATGLGLLGSAALEQRMRSSDEPPPSEPS